MNGARARAGARAGAGTAAFDAIAPTYDASRGGTARAAGFAGQLAPLLDPGEPVLDIGVGTGIVAAELGRVLWGRPDQRAAFGAVDPKAEEGDDAERRRPTTTRRGFPSALAGLGRPHVPGVGSPASPTRHGLTARGHRVYGVDLSPGMLAHARSRLGARVAVGDAGRLPVRTASVAQAVSTWLLHAGPAPRAVFAEVARVLRPGGRYLVIPARGMRPADDIGRIVGELEDRLDPDGTRQDSPALLAPVAAAHGLCYEGPASERPAVFHVSPEGMARSIADGRLFTGAWQVRPEDLPLVAEACARLRALPEPWRPRVREMADFVMVFRKA
ncbi:methyltransferase domain-containing protein [Streptomyces sp. NPDC048623]|uniref:class I SAM-dependent methyltransferase n=1 Tax=Streptomyces sp. NPDC048623 TaxID=3155761 RepID=UPI0034257ED0